MKQGQAGPFFVVLSGPSGVGKDTVLNRLRDRYHTFYYAVTATTRQRRAVETHPYHFYSDAEFKKMVDGGEFVEWALVYGHYYGTPRFEVEGPLRAGKNVLVRVDVQGAASIRKLFPEAILIFIRAPSKEELAQRLRERNLDSEADLAKRLARAEEEMATLPIFDYVVMNRQGKLDETLEAVEAIITAERCRVHPRKINF